MLDHYCLKMKNKMCSSPSFLVAFTLHFLSIFNPFLLAHANQNTNATVNNFAHGICNRLIQYNDLYKVCIPEIDSDPREDLKSDLTGLLIIFVNHSISNFNDNIVFLKKEINSGKVNGDTKDIMSMCLENFETGISALQESLHILLTQTGIDVYQLSMINVENYVSECVEDFEGNPIPNPPEWQSRYNSSWNLLGLILVMSNLIKCNRVISCIP